MTMGAQSFAYDCTRGGREIMGKAKPEIQLEAESTHRKPKACDIKQGMTNIVTGQVLRQNTFAD